MARARDIANIINSGTFLTPASASATYTTKDENGLTLIHSSSFSNVTNHPTNNVFNSSYRDYRVMINFSKSSGNATTNVFLRLMSQGSENSTSNYFYNRTTTWNSSFRGGGGEYAVNTINLGELYYTNSIGLLTFDIMNPNLSNSPTEIAGSILTTDAGIPISGVLNAKFLNSTSFDGFSIYSSATLYGTIKIYGYK